MRYISSRLFSGEDFLYIRPSDEFELSDIPVDWRSIDLRDDTEDSSLFSSFCSTKPPSNTLKYLILTCRKKSDSTKHFNIKVRGEKVNVLYGDTDRLDCDESHVYSIKLIPMVRLRNLLPYPVLFSYEPVELQIVKLGYGEEVNLPYAMFGQTRKCLFHWISHVGSLNTSQQQKDTTNINLFRSRHV